MSLQSLIKQCASKARYHTQESAEKALHKAAKARKTPLRIYVCSHCLCFHLTKLNATVPLGPPKPKAAHLCQAKDCSNQHAKGQLFCGQHKERKLATKQRKQCQEKGCLIERKSGAQYCAQHCPPPVHIARPERRSKLIAAGIIKS